MFLSHMHPSFSPVGVPFFFFCSCQHCLEKPVGKNTDEYEKSGKHLFVRIHV